MSETRRLMVVDDNEANRDGLSRLLELKGYTVSMAESGLDALARLDAVACDLVLLDVEMPGMSGFEVTREIRSRWSSTELPVIMPIGHAVLRDGCRQLAEWQRRFGPDAPESVCVNVSSRQFLDAGLARTIEDVLASTGLRASSLKLEVTESAFVGDVDAARATVERLQRIGIEWSLDDFGTGYSSLSHLHRLRLDTVKVDRSFVRRIGDGGEGLEMVRAIVALGHHQGMDVVAEGVETEAQLIALRALGCEFCQGFLFSRPVDAEGAAS